MARTRNRSTVRTGPNATHSTLGPAASSITITEYCSDTVGDPAHDHAFILERTNNFYWSLNGFSNRVGTNRWSYNGYTKAGAIPGFASASAPVPSDNQSISTALARTNPNSSTVEIHVFAFELRDIVRNLWDKGLGFLKTLDRLDEAAYLAQRAKEPWAAPYFHSASKFRQKSLKSYKNSQVSQRDIERYKRDLQGAPKGFADDFLSVIFGVLPMMQDLKKMMQFQSLTEKKLGHLRRLKSKSGLKRKWTVYQNDVLSADKGDYVTTLYQESQQCKYKLRTTRVKWVSMRWLPTADLPDSDEQLRKTANDLVFGNTPDLSTLWKALPWSWMVDWFSNVGDLLEGQRNKIPVKPDGVCVMHTQKVIMEDLRMTAVQPGSGVSIRSSGAVLRLSKTRVTSFLGPFPEYHLPFLGEGQLSILSALLGKQLHP